MSDELQTRELDDAEAELSSADAASESFVDGRLAAIERLGRYRLLERVGRGAFGTVWAAYDPELDRKVAIKFVLGSHGGGRTGSTSAAQRSLINEAQMLAQLSHPNVVAIHDVGRVERAQPELGTRGVFIVMEYLAGLTLHTWLDRQAKLPVSTRRAKIISVFLDAGRGLEAAHAQGLVHLDFKPSNAMFGEDGRIRVLDFGLAMLMRQRGSGSRVAGTPAYMAPEQHLGQPADARADQYAFCASLWHALYGEPPFDAVDYREIAKLKLSTVLQAPRESSVPPHIYAVLERGLAPQPDDRFASMEELLAALADDPITRRRRRVVGAGLLLATLAAGFGLSQLSTRRADPCVLEADALRGVWDEDTQAAVSDSFLATQASYAGETFTELDTLLGERVTRWKGVRRELCRAALVEGSAPVERMGEQMLCLDRQLRRTAELSASFVNADAELVARALASVRELDNPARCREVGAVASPSLSAAERRERAQPADTKLASAEVAELLARYEPGLEAADEAVRAAEAIEDPLSLARAHAQRSRLLRHLGRLDEAVLAEQVALEAVAAAGNEREARTIEAQILVDAVTLRESLGSFEAAVSIAGLVRARVDPERDPKLAVALRGHAGSALIRLQRWDEAVAELEAGIAICESSFGAEDPLAAPLYIQLATALSDSSRDPQQAMRHFEHAIGLWTEAYGARHPLIGRAQLNLAGIHFRRGELEAAVTPLEQALELFDAVYPPGHPTIGVARQNLGALQFSLGNYAAAQPLFERSARAIAAKLGEDHPEYATAARNLASVYILLGRPRDARPYFEAASEIYARTLEPTDNRVVLLTAERAEVAWWLGDAEAFARHTESLAGALASTELNDGRRMSPESMLMSAELGRGEFEAALARGQALLGFMREHVGADHVDTVRARVLLAEVLRALGRHEQARTELEQGLAALQQGEGEHASAWNVRLELGRLELELGRPGKALEWLEPARAGLDPGLMRALVELELARALIGRDRAQARALLDGASAIIREQGPRPELLEAITALERELS